MPLTAPDLKSPAPDEASTGELLSGLFAVHSLWTHRGMVVVRGFPLGEPEAVLVELRQRASLRQWVLRADPMEQGYLITVEPRPVRRFPWLAATLFLLTLLSVVLGRPATMGFEPGQSFWDLVLQELPFAYALLPILLAHEFGHYLAARRHSYPASLPYFIPGVFPFGTFGAIIVARHPFRDRRVLFDIAVAGPLAGFVVAIPVVWLGLAHSQWIPTDGAAGVTVWDPLLMKMFAALALGPSPGEGWDILLHPAAFGGWAGLFVTMMNLLPFGPLDGGKTAYALFGKRQKWIALVSWGALACTLLFSRFWLLWLGLTLVFRLPHPPTLNDSLAIGPARQRVGILVAIVFVLSFMPFPFSF